MADEEQEKALKIDLKDIPLMGDPLKIKLDCAEAVKTGEGQYGNWYLWFGYVTNTKATDGRGTEAKIVDNYSGKVLFFPTEKLNEKLVDACKGNINVEVGITKTVREGKRGLIREYQVEKLSEGRPVQASLTPTEIKFIGDVEDLKRKGFKVDEQTMITASKENVYEGKLSEERVRELYNSIK